jgi:hypothetical protein
MGKTHRRGGSYFNSDVGSGMEFVTYICIYIYICMDMYRNFSAFKFMLKQDPDKYGFGLSLDVILV